MTGKKGSFDLVGISTKDRNLRRVAKKEDLGIDKAEFSPITSTAPSQNDDEKNEKLNVESVRESRDQAENLGNSLEDVCEQILRNIGYCTERNQKLAGKSGTASEIHILAKRGNKLIAVECKNYVNDVGIDQVKEFCKKLEDLRIHHALMVTNVSFSEDAQKYASQQDIVLWDGEQLQEYFTNSDLLRVGASKPASSLSNEITLPRALPVQMKLQELCTINLANASAAKIGRPTLFLHPYYLLQYRLEAQLKDPSRGMHKIQNEGVYVVDATDGQIINPDKQKENEDRMDIKLRDKLAGDFPAVVAAMAAKEHDQVVRDLLEIKAYLHYKVQRSKDFDVVRLRRVLSFKSARSSVTQEIIGGNMKKISYRIRISKKRFLQRRMYIAPKDSDIRIKKMLLVYVPKWIAEIKSGQFTFARRVLATSKTVIEDTISKCPRHLAFGHLGMGKKHVTHALCETCGGAFCADHLVSIGNRYYCLEHNPSKGK